LKTVNIVLVDESVGFDPCLLALPLSPPLSPSSIFWPLPLLFLRPGRPRIRHDRRIL